MTPEQLKEYKRRVLEKRRADETAFQQMLQENQRRIVASYPQQQAKHRPNVSLLRYWNQRRQPGKKR